ncbi:hypothetical protein [Caulobacter sp. 602-2]|uniref:hypothetical protein n=1 Tax=Caulobacter sp. 602-2 TaxID=2710887 RepID=UPI001F0E9173|nr:hypothetical protein [Caulobacter sp. 602-2]
MLFAARLVKTLPLGLALLAAPVLAHAAGADDEVVATAKATSSPAQAEAAPAPAAPAATRPLTTQEQIDAWLKAAPVRTTSEDGPLNLSRDDDAGPIKRKVHGSVEVGVGTGGYRHVAATALFPVGETGTLGVAVAQTDYGKNGRWAYGYDGLGYGPGYGGLGYGGYGYGPYGFARGGKSQSIALSLDMSGRSSAERCVDGVRADDGRYVEPLWATQMRGAQRPCDIDDRP